MNVCCVGERGERTYLLEASAGLPRHDVVPVCLGQAFERGLFNPLFAQRLLFTVELLLLFCPLLFPTIKEMIPQSYQSHSPPVRPVSAAP